MVMCADKCIGARSVYPSINKTSKNRPRICGTRFIHKPLNTRTHKRSPSFSLYHSIYSNLPFIKPTVAYVYGSMFVYDGNRGNVWVCVSVCLYADNFHRYFTLNPLTLCITVSVYLNFFCIQFLSSQLLFLFVFCHCCALCAYMVKIKSFHFSILIVHFAQKD